MFTFCLISANFFSFAVRTFRFYRPPKKIHHELRPEAPPFHDKYAKFNKAIKTIQNLEEEESKKLIEGLDYPLMTGYARPKLLACSTGVYDPYKPPESHSKTPYALSKALLQPLKMKDRFFLRRIRQSMDDFDKSQFLETANDVYKKLFLTLSRRPLAKMEDLLKYCTEHCYPILTNGLERCQIKWQYVDTVEPSRIVAAKVDSVMQVRKTFTSSIIITLPHYAKIITSVVML